MGGRKERLPDAGPQTAKHAEPPRWVGGTAALAGILLMFWGLYRNELELLFTKAINICLECIGIG